MVSNKETHKKSRKQTNDTITQETHSTSLNHSQTKIKNCIHQLKHSTPPKAHDSNNNKKIKIKQNLRKNTMYFRPIESDFDSADGEKKFNAFKLMLRGSLRNISHII